MIVASRKGGQMSHPVRRIDGKQDPCAPRYLPLAQPLTDWVATDDNMLAKVSDLGAGMSGSLQIRYCHKSQSS